MPRGGQNRKSPGLKRLSGTGRGDRTSSSPPASPGEPTPPIELKGKARRKWDELIPRLVRRRVLSEDDGEALAVMCIHWAVMMAAYRDVEKRGVMVRGQKGTVKNPALQVLRDASTAFSSYFPRFGLSPADRDKAQRAEEPEAEDPFA